VSKGTFPVLNGFNCRVYPQGDCVQFLDRILLIEACLMSQFGRKHQQLSVIWGYLFRGNNQDNVPNFPRFEFDC